MVSLVTWQHQKNGAPRRFKFFQSIFHGLHWEFSWALSRILQMLEWGSWRWSPVEFGSNFCSWKDYPLFGSFLLSVELWSRYFGSIFCLNFCWCSPSAWARWILCMWMWLLIGSSRLVLTLKGGRDLSFVLGSVLGGSCGSLALWGGFKTRSCSLFYCLLKYPSPGDYWVLKRKR